MSIFSAINTSTTGMDTFRSWLDVISNNIANISTARPTSGPAFQASYLQVQAIPGGTAEGAPPTGNDVEDNIGQGVESVSLPSSSATGRLTYSPQNPEADSKGYVRMPDIDMNEQMGDLIMAQRGFQANAGVVTRAKDVYAAAIGIGKNG
jgi:flagellar basal-body rod protein FlgC